MYNTILLAIDSSEPSNRAAAAATELAKLSGGTVHVFHAREHQDVIGKSGGSFDVEESEEASKLVQVQTDALAGAGVNATSKVVHIPLGRVAHEIIDAAKAIDADTIVMGSHGRTSFGAVVMGSTAYKVLHLTDRPVLIVR